VPDGRDEVEAAVYARINKVTPVNKDFYTVVNRYKSNTIHCTLHTYIIYSKYSIVHRKPYSNLKSKS
jgi:hypothetical protein